MLISMKQIYTVAYSPMDYGNQRDAMDELLGFASVPNDASGTQGLAPDEGVCGCTCSGSDMRQGSSPFPLQGGAAPSLPHMGGTSPSPKAPLVSTPVMMMALSIM